MIVNFYFTEQTGRTWPWSCPTPWPRTSTVGPSSPWATSSWPRGSCMRPSGAFSPASAPSLSYSCPLFQPNKYPHIPWRLEAEYNSAAETRLRTSSGTRAASGRSRRVQHQLVVVNSSSHVSRLRSWISASSLLVNNPQVCKDEDNEHTEVETMKNWF